MTEISELMASIRNAWADADLVLRAKADAALSIDPDHPECQETRRCFRGRAWADIPSETLTAEYPNPFLLPPAALCYYLPAFLIASLQDPQSMLDHTLVEYKLRPPKKAAALQWFQERYVLLDHRKCAAVVAFLRYYREYYAGLGQDRTVRRIDDGLSRYWLKRAENQSVLE